MQAVTGVVRQVPQAGTFSGRAAATLPALVDGDVGLVAGGGNARRRTARPAARGSQP